MLGEELQRAVAEDRPVSLMIFDIDRFKRVNDSHGHRAGDQVLVSVARELSRNARDTDTPCRYGGDEFLVLLAGMDSQAAGRAAERLRTAVSDTPVRFGDVAIAVTISVGVASIEPGADGGPGSAHREGRPRALRGEAGRPRQDRRRGPDRLSTPRQPAPGPEGAVPATSPEVRRKHGEA